MAQAHGSIAQTCSISAPEDVSGASRFLSSEHRIAQHLMHTLALRSVSETVMWWGEAHKGADL